MRAIGGAADDPPRFVARYGPPDLDESPGEEPGRPLLALRLLTYHRERVRAVYVRDESAAGPPKWALLGFTEPGTNAVLGPEGVVERMKGRGAPQEGG